MIPADNPPTIFFQPPAPIVVKGRLVHWKPLAFTGKEERSSDYRVQDPEGRDYAVHMTPSGVAAWIASEPDEQGRPIIAIFTQNRLEVEQ